MIVTSARVTTALLLGAALSFVAGVPAAGAQQASGVGMGGKASAGTRVAVGKQAPQLTFKRWLSAPKTDTAKTTTFGDGHVYVLDFTATWCAPCRKTYPVMAKLEKEYGAKGLRVIYVMELWGAVTGSGQSPDEELEATSAYIAKHHLTPVAFLGKARKLMTSGYSGRSGSLPDVVVIDGGGKIRALGGFDESAVTRAVTSALADARPAHSKAP